VYVPQKGRISLAGTSLVGARRRAASLGIGRTFQNLGLFPGLTVVENLLLGRHVHMRTGFLAGALWVGRARREENEQRAQIAGVIELLDLGAYRDTPVAALPYGVQKRVELGRALAMEPRLLLLDEPVAGMGTGEMDAIRGYLHQMREARPEMGIILVEHDMPFVMGLADRVLALDFGNVIAVGTPSEVAADEKVIAAYLGTGEEAA
jgi:branched-chain amino acid transport system ATP-binding protein